jgi:hypothetical protein
MISQKLLGTSFQEFSTGTIFTQENTINSFLRTGFKERKFYVPWRYFLTSGYIYVRKPIVIFKRDGKEQ